MAKYHLAKFPRSGTNRSDRFTTCYDNKSQKKIPDGYQMVNFGLIGPQRRSDTYWCQLEYIINETVSIIYDRSSARQPVREAVDSVVFGGNCESGPRAF